MNTLYFKLDCLTKMFAYADAAKGEISGMGLVEKIDDMFVVTETYLLKQKCSFATTEIDSDDLGKLMLELAGQGKESSLKLWWHSHASMDTFWSGTDNNTAKLLSGSNWMFRIVVNKSSKLKASLDVNTPFHHVLDNIQVSVYDPDAGRISELCRKEVKEKVKESKKALDTQADMFDRPGGFDELEYCPDCYNIVLNNEKKCSLCGRKITRRYRHETDVPGKKRNRKHRKRKVSANIQHKKRQSGRVGEDLPW